MGEPLSDEKLAELRQIAVSGTGRLVSRWDVLDLLDTIAADREAHANEVFSLRANVEKWHNALRMDSMEHREVEAELRQELDEAVTAEDHAEAVEELEQHLRELGAEVEAASRLAQAMATAIGWETEGDNWADKAENWAAAHGPLPYGPPPVVQAELRKAINDWWMTETDGPLDADVDLLVEALVPVIAAEVTAKASEAQVAVPEPLSLGVVDDYEHVSTDPDAYMVHVNADAHVPIGSEVGIWSADLAEQAERTRQENTQLACRVQDAWKRAEEVEHELDAMTAVARLLLDGWELDDNELSIDDSAESRGMTDAERRALDVLDRLSETREGESDG